MEDTLKEFREVLSRNVPPGIMREMPLQNSYFLEYSTGRIDAERVQNPPPIQQQQQHQQSQQMQQGGHGGGGTFKISTLKLKMGRVLAFAAGATASLVAAASSPILFVMTFVAAAAAVLDMSNAPLSENEASILWTMSRSEILIERDNLRRRTDEERLLYGLPPLTDAQFEYALDRLQQLRCIERSGIFHYRLLEEFEFNKIER